MTDLASKWFNGEDLGRYGLATPKMRGVFGAAGEKNVRVFTPGSDVPSDLPLYGDLVEMVWSSVVAADTHDELVGKLKALQRLLNPRLGWCEVRVPNRPAERTLAKCLAWPVNFDSLPFGTRVAEFDLRFERLPYWEDLEPIISTASTVYNTGDLEAYPVYTVTFAGAVSGFWFDVGGATHTHLGSRVPGDTVVVTSGHLADVETNGTRDFAHTHADSSFPPLAVGANVITTSSADVLVSVSFRRRFE